MFTLLECVGAGAIPPDFEDTLAVNQLPNQGKSLLHSLHTEYM